MDVQYLRSILSYEPETGIFRWRVKRKNMNPNDAAGFINSKGYRYVTVQNVAYRANRLAWFYVNGVWPTGQIDHINRNRLDDRIKNLRVVTGNANQHNRSLNKNNTSGFQGVCPKGNRYRAQITVNSKVHYLGSFETPEDAHAAYLAAKHKLHTSLPA
jgi:hypothetical protein